MVNKMEVWRKQIEDQVKANALEARRREGAEGSGQADLGRRDTSSCRARRCYSDDKYFPEAYKVYMNLIWLSGGVGQGASDEAGSIDYKPTDTQMQVLDE